MEQTHGKSVASTNRRRKNYPANGYLVMEHVSARLLAMANDLGKARDNEVSMAQEVLGQYVQDHRDKDAYRQIDRQVNALARAWDRMEFLLRKSAERAEAIEARAENFYGD